MALATAGPGPGLSMRDRAASFDQAYLVLAVTIALCVFGELTVDRFLAGDNLSNLLRLSASFAILAIGQSIVVLGRGIDLSGAGVALGCSQATLALMSGGMSEGAAIVTMVVLAAVVGLGNGLLVAYLEVPALFATLATGLLAIGAINIVLIDDNFYQVPDGSLIQALASGSVLGVPKAVVVAGLAFVAAWLFISYTAPGKLIRAMGDNHETARASGAPVRPLQVLTYVTAALCALLAGYLSVSIQGSSQTVQSSFHPILFTALTVTVIGGVSLSGGRGTVFGVLAGTLFVGVLNSLLILQGLSSAGQDLVRGAVLIGAIALDAWLHPRDDETAKSGEL